MDAFIAAMLLEELKEFALKLFAQFPALLKGNLPNFKVHLSSGQKLVITLNGLVLLLARTHNFLELQRLIVSKFRHTHLDTVVALAMSDPRACNFFLLYYPTHISKATYGALVTACNKRQLLAASDQINKILSVDERDNISTFVEWHVRCSMCCGDFTYLFDSLYAPDF